MEFAINYFGSDTCAIDVRRSASLGVLIHRLLNYMVEPSMLTKLGRTKSGHGRSPSAVVAC